MKKVYIIDNDTFASVITIQKPDNFDPDKDKSEIKFTENDVVSDPANARNYIYDHTEDNSDVKHYWAPCDDWVWTDNKEVFDAVMDACEELDVEELSMDTNHPGIRVTFEDDNGEFRDNYVYAGHVNVIADAQDNDYYEVDE